MATQTSKEEAVLGCIAALVWMAAGPIVNGWVLTWLWRWFAVPFASQNGLVLQQMNIPLAIGIAAICGHLTHQISFVKDEYEKSPWERLWQIIFLPFFTLLLGWVVQHWV